MSKDCSNTYRSIGEGTSELGNIYQHNGVFGFKDAGSCTVSGVQTSSNKLQGEENLPQHVVFGDRLINVSQYHDIQYPQQHTVPIAAQHVTEASKKKQG